MYLTALIFVAYEDLRKTVAICKNTQSIETIIKIAEIYRKVYDNATFKEVSELQWEQMFMVNKVMNSTNTKNIHNACLILESLEKKSLPHN